MAFLPWQTLSCGVVDLAPLWQPLASSWGGLEGGYSTVP